MMSRISISLAAATLALAFAGCATTDSSSSSSSPVVVRPTPIAPLGQDLETAVAEATQIYIESKGGQADWAWSASKIIEAYQLYVKTKGDVKELLEQWNDGTAAGKTFAEKLSELFSVSSGNPKMKAAVLAQGVEIGARGSESP